MENKRRKSENILIEIIAWVCALGFFWVVAKSVVANW